MTLRTLRIEIARMYSHFRLEELGPFVESLCVPPSLLKEKVPFRSTTTGKDGSAQTGHSSKSSSSSASSRVVPTPGGGGDGDGSQGAGSGGGSAGGGSGGGGHGGDEDDEDDDVQQVCIDGWLLSFVCFLQSSFPVS